MNTEPTLLAAAAPRPTQHGLLVCWGQFAQELGLLDHLQAVPIPQKTVTHSPAAKLTTLFMGLLSGVEYLTDLTHAPAPLYHDPTLAAAWGLPALPEASGVSRTLAAATPQSLAALQTVLATLTQPFLERALQAERLRSRPLVLDVDLTGQPLADSSTSFPNAAFGYMDGEIRLGYQLAVVCLRTALYGRQWLVGEQHPGNTVSAPCLLHLLATAEARLGGHPRRRPELLDPHIAALQATAQAATTQAEEATRRRAALLAERTALQDELRGVLRRVCALRQTGQPTLARAQAEARLAQGQARLAWLGAQTAHLARQEFLAQEAAHRGATALAALVARRAALAAENAAQPAGPRVVLRMDAGFSSGANLSAVLELGYELETKSANPAVVAALLARRPAQTVWTPVGKQAAMVGFAAYTLSTCPYPLTVGLERFQTAEGPKYAVLLRSAAAPGGGPPDLRAWFKRYNERGDMEAAIKQGKTVFHVQHLFSRRRVGMQIQIALTLFAANFVQWAAAWLGERLVARPGQVAAALQSVKRAVRSAANAPALVEGGGAALVVRFSPWSSWAGLVVGLGGPTAIQMELPLLAACGWGSSG